MTTAHLTVYAYLFKLSNVSFFGTAHSDFPVHNALILAGYNQLIQGFRTSLNTFFNENG
jgi:hypothetical protein